MAYEKDPALRPGNALEALLYPGVWALAAYRLAHRVRRAGVPFLPRLVSQLARALTGIEIHPGAEIGRRCFIDHGAGVVVGETAIIGTDVMLYHGVTLGGHGWWTDVRGAKRHPTIGDNVVLGANCSVLGPVHVGANSKIGPHALVIDDVPPDSVVVGTRGRCIVRAGVRQRSGGAEEWMSPDWMTSREEKEQT